MLPKTYIWFICPMFTEYGQVSDHRMDTELTLYDKDHQLHCVICLFLTRSVLILRIQLSLIFIIFLSLYFIHILHTTYSTQVRQLLRKESLCKLLLHCNILGIQLWDHVFILGEFPFWHTSLHSNILDNQFFAGKFVFLFLFFFCQQQQQQKNVYLLNYLFASSFTFRWYRLVETRIRSISLIFYLFSYCSRDSSSYLLLNPLA